MSTIANIIESLTYPNQNIREGHMRRNVPNYGAYLRLADYDWHPDANFTDSGEIFKIPLIDMKATTPKIIVKEFQPELFLTAFVDALKNLWDLGTDLARNDGTSLKEKIQTKLNNAIQKQFGSVGNSTESIDAISRGVYKKLIGGMYLQGGYEIPLLDDDVKFLNGQGSAGWEARSLAESLFQGLTDIAKNVGLDGINLPARPMYTQNGNGPTCPSISTTVRLYNYNLDALKRNLNFIYALVSGSFWTQTHIVVRSSNLYNIYLPGRMNYYFCTLNSTVSSVGKLRKLNNDGNNTLIRKITANTGDANATLFPDAYDLSVEFSSLAPNSFNMLMGSIEGELQGFSTSQQPTNSYFNEFLTNLSEG